MGLFEELIGAGLKMAANAIENKINQTALENTNIASITLSSMMPIDVLNNGWFETILENCGNLLQIRITNETRNINWTIKTSTTSRIGNKGEYEDIFYESFVITNGMITIKYGPYGLGARALEISGKNCGRLLEPIKEFLSNLSYCNINQIACEKVPFNDEKNWLENSKQFLLNTINKDKIEKEKKSQGIESSIKVLTFLLGRKKELSESDKEFIETAITSMFEEELKEFDIDISKKIENTYHKIKHLKKSEDFFINNKINEIHPDAKNIVFVMSIILFFTISDEDENDKFKPEYVYNLYLIRKNLNLTKHNEDDCIKAIGHMTQNSVDEIKTAFENIFSEKTISTIEERFPELLDGYPVDFKEDVEEIYLNLLNEFGNKIELLHLHLAYKSPEKLKKVINSYAKNATSDEKPILILDNSAFSNCKTGFLVTDKHIYAKNSFSFSSICLEIQNIENIYSKSEYGVQKIFFDSAALEVEQIGDKKLVNFLSDSLKTLIEKIKIAKDINLPDFEDIFNEDKGE